MKYFVATILVLLALGSSRASAGGIDGGGGSAFAAEFADLAYHAAHELSGIKNFPVKPKQFTEAVVQTRVEFTGDPLKDVTGHEVDAVNFPSKKLIRVNIGRWSNYVLDGDHKLQLVVHEFLGILDVNDMGYRYSKQILEGGVPVETMVCNWTAPAGWGIHGKLVYYFFETAEVSDLLTGPANMTTYLNIEVPNVPEAVDSTKLFVVGTDDNKKFAFGITWSAVTTALTTNFPLDVIVGGRLGTFTTKVSRLGMAADGAPTISDFATMTCSITKNQR